MADAKATMFTGSQGLYEWLATELHDLDTFLQRCPQAVLGKYVAVTSLDSGQLRVTDEEKNAGWLSRDGIAYSPKVQSTENLPHGGYDEWYIFDSPKDLGEIWQGNVFEAPTTPGHISVFINFGYFAPHNPEVEPLVSLFWQQVDRIQPESYVADGNEFLTFASRDRQLFAAVYEALAKP